MLCEINITKFILLVNDMFSDGCIAFLVIHFMLSLQYDITSKRKWKNSERGTHENILLVNDSYFEIVT